MEKSFNNWRHNAIHLTFANGNSISTTWAKYSYADNRDYEGDFEDFLQSNNCEVMVLKCSDKLSKKIYKKFDGDGVIGYLTIDKWLEILNMLAKEKTNLSTQPSQE